jgi:DNA polymerase-3 subunit alpha
MAKMRARFQNSNVKELKVQSVEYMQTVKENAVDRITISMITDMLDEQIVADLSEIISENPGKTKLFFQLRDSKGHNHVLLRSKGEGVDVRHKLIDYIEQHEMLDYQIN